MRRRWLFADQLGPHFLDDGGQPLLIIESRRVLERTSFRQKAHLVLSAVRQRVAALGDRVTYLRLGSYREGLDQVSDACRSSSPRRGPPCASSTDWPRNAIWTGCRPAASLPRASSFPPGRRVAVGAGC